MHCAGLPPALLPLFLLHGAGPAAAAVDLPVPGLQGMRAWWGLDRGPSRLKVARAAAKPGQHVWILFPQLPYSCHRLYCLPVLLLGVQIEEHYISAAELGRLTGVPADLILRTELVALQASARGGLPCAGAARCAVQC